MIAMQSNLSLIMDYLSVTSKELSIELNIDSSLISRWKSGERRLTPDGFGAKALADYFYARAPADTQTFLLAACPVEMQIEKQPKEVLRLWLCKYTGREERLSILSLLSNQMAYPGCQDGIEAARRALANFLDYAENLPSPGEILFSCPDGLSIFTRNGGYNLPLQAKLTRIFQRGFHLQTVLRTDYRISDVAMACGPWLRSHLHEYIQSYYYDDFTLSEDEKIIICLPGHLAIETRVNDAGIETSVWSSPEKIKNVQRCFEYIRSNAVQRFRYHFFNEPKGFFTSLQLCKDKPVYLFQRLPCYGIGNDKTMAQLFNLSEAERTLFHREFAPLLVPPHSFSAPVYHVIDAGAVDNVLDHNRLLCRTMSQICARRVFMSSKQLALQIVLMRKELAECPTYHLLCLNSDAFEQIDMELGVWGNEAAIAWLSDASNSTACKDYPNVSALQGFCATIWKQSAASKRIAMEKLDSWIRRAQKMNLF